jgi:ribosomal protein S18 acetylase RimI-like enzyme
MERVVLKEAQANLIPSIGRIHHDTLPDDFLPSLGLDFLEQIYYPAAIASKNGITLVALVGREPIGFVTVAHHSRNFTRDILRGNLLAILKYSLRMIIRDVRYLIKNIQVFWSAVITKPDPIKGEIVFIAVDQDYHGQGIGKKLVYAALDYLSLKGSHLCRTKTLAENDGVIKMYEAMGWHLRDRFRLIGREYVTIVSPPIHFP